MASLISHAVVGLNIGAAFCRSGTPKRTWIGAVCAMFPDIDVIGFHFGIRYGDFWGHRGFTHSLLFAAILAAFAVSLFFRGCDLEFSRRRLWCYFSSLLRLMACLTPPPMEVSGWHFSRRLKTRVIFCLCGPFWYHRLE